MDIWKNLDIVRYPESGSNAQLSVGNELSETFEFTEYTRFVDCQNFIIPSIVSNQIMAYLLLQKVINLTSNQIHS